MARIKGVSARETGPLVRIGYRFARRQIARLSGREPERMIEPVEMYAQVPGLLRGYARLEQATARLHRVDDRLKVLAELKAATLTHCEYCIDLGSQIARRCGLSDEQLLALPSYRTSALFTDVEKLVLDYAANDVPIRTHCPPSGVVALSNGSMVTPRSSHAAAVRSPSTGPPSVDQSVGGRT